MTPSAIPSTTSGTNAAGEAANVLLVEDNPADARLIELQLRESGGFSVERVATLRAALSALAARSFDVVLLDLSLPDEGGAATFEGLHRAAPGTPVVILTDIDDDATAISMVHAGAQDYLVKGTLEARLVARSLRCAMVRHRLLQSVEVAKRHESDMKDRLLSHVSHELRSPLALAFLYTTNVLDGVVGPISEVQREHLVVAADGLRAQMRLIDELIATARSNAGLIGIEKTEVSIPALIARTVHGFGRHSSGANILDESPADLPPVHVDVHRIQQVLTTLIDNALTLSPSAGTVRVRASAASGEPGFVRIDVEDDGPGISDASREHLFDRFFFGQDPDKEGKNGLGLGLYLSKLLVTRHGGRIWAERAGERGSRFSFTLPFPAAPGDAKQAATA